MNQHIVTSFLEQAHNISRLMNYLIKTSNASVLPVVSRNKTTGKTLALKVKIGLTLYQIINVVKYLIIQCFEIGIRTIDINKTCGHQIFSKINLKDKYWIKWVYGIMAALKIVNFSLFRVPRTILKLVQSW